MPAPGWRSVSLPEGTVRMVDAVAGWTERSSAFVVNRILETALREILLETPAIGKRGRAPQGPSFDEEAAGRFGISGPPNAG